jgi:hypothetical protein
MSRTSATTSTRTAGLALASDLVIVQDDVAALTETVEDLTALSHPIPLGEYLGAEIRVLSSGMAQPVSFPLLSSPASTALSAGGAGTVRVGASGGADQVRIELITLSGTPPASWQPTYMGMTLWNLTTGDEYTATSVFGSLGSPIGAWQGPLLWDSVTGTGASLTVDNENLILPENALYAFVAYVVLSQP